MHPARAIDAIAEDPDGNRVLECAAENVSDFIVTHDKDLLRRKRFEGIPIVRSVLFGPGIRDKVVGQQAVNHRRLKAFRSSRLRRYDFLCALTCGHHNRITTPSGGTLYT